MRRILLGALLVAPSLLFSQTDSLLADVVVTGTRSVTPLSVMPQTINIIERDALTEHERVSILPTLAELVPSLYVTSRALLGYGVSDGAAGTITMRGVSSASGGLMVLIDGHPQYQGLFGHAVADPYTTQLAEKVEVVRGPASTLYGSNAMGGVINIVTREQRTNGSQTDASIGGGSYNTWQASASNIARKGRFTSMVGGQFATSDNHRPNMDFYQYGGTLKLGYEISDHWKASGNAELTHFAASYPGSTDSPLLDARQWINRGAAELRISNRYAKAQGAVSAYYNFGRHKINDGHAETAAAKTYYFRSNDALAGLSLYETLRPWKGSDLTLGLDYQHIYGWAGNEDMATGEITRTTGNEGNEHEDEVAGYVNLRQDILSWLTFEGGVRLDYHSQAGAECVPQGGLVARPTAHSTLKATVSKGFRNPSLREMYLWVPANDSLLPERLVTYELAWRHTLLGGKITYALTAYYIKGSNMIQTVLYNGKKRNMNTGEISNSGCEAELAWRINNRWQVDANYSYLHMRNIVVASPEHKAYAGARYRLGKLSLSGGLQYIHGLYTDASAGTTESCALLNLTAHYQAHPNVSFWLKGDNLLGQHYEINAGYPMPKATVMAGVNIHI